MTYNQLKTLLSNLTPEQLNMNVTVRVVENDEFYPIQSFIISDANIDVLDENHPFIEI